MSLVSGVKIMAYGVAGVVTSMSRIFFQKP